MDYNCFVSIIKELRKRGKVLTNTFPGCMEGARNISIIEKENAIVACVDERFRKRAFFATVDNDSGRKDFCSIVKQIPKGTMVEWLQKEINDYTNNNPSEECELNELFKSAELEFYKKYFRAMNTYNINPYSIPEEGRRRILWDMYEPGGEYASSEDAKELYEIHRRIFDPKSDDTFTLDEWERIINNNNCLVHKEEGRIIAYYVWELQGKKLYSNVAVNLGPANVLYNMERRVFEECWDLGIRSFYAWFEAENAVAVNRGPNSKAKAKTKKNSTETCCVLKSQSILYNYIYQKK